MIDIHSHIVFGVDDGAPSLEESVRMVFEAEEAGVRVIFATAHYYEQGTDILKYYKNLQILRDYVPGSQVTLYPGFEVMLSPRMLEEPAKYRELTLGSSGHLLLEFPFNGTPLYDREAIFRLQVEGIIPILAHPERNIYLMRNPRRLKELAEAGCRIQVDAASIIGVYGGRTAGFCRQLIFSGLVDFIASDAHRSHGYSEWHQKANRMVSRWIGADKADKLFHTNDKSFLEFTDQQKTEDTTHLENANNR